MDGEGEVSRVEDKDLDRLFEVVDDIHILLDEADRQHRESYPVLIGSGRTNGNEKSSLGIPA